MKTDTTSAQFFERMYCQSADPWAFATSPYEQRRYAAILAAVAGRRYRRVFEPGCSIGILTERLASISDEVIAMDISPTAVAEAQQRTRHLPNVQTTCGALPTLLPDGTFDLIVFSEIGYYFTAQSLLALATQLIDRNCKSGVFLAAHWLGESPDHLLSGDQVHETLATIPTLTHRHAERHDGFRLDLWFRR